MSSSFFALLDDIAVLARAAAASVDDVIAGAGAASAKATGVVIDDAAVTPQYVRGISPKRELPVVRRIARGSLLNKAIIIAIILPLSILLPQAIPWLLILGGSYLAYEGAEKAWHWWFTQRRSRRSTDVQEALERTSTDENQIVRAALRTDVVLSGEIMLISLGAIASDSWLVELGTLIVVAITMTLGVYGVVGMLIKLDDVGIWLVRRRTQVLKQIGRGLIRTMPRVFALLTVVGVLAMLWIGGQILIENLTEVGWAAPHLAFEPLPWGVRTVISAATGLAWGSIITGLLLGARKLRRGGSVRV